MKIGILGGTFDPIHLGHIQPLQEVKEALALDKVWLMPNHIPPHKQQPNSSTADRLAMARLVCEQYDWLELCDIETQRQTPSYSVETLATLRRAHPNNHFLFIMGMDSFASLPSWYHWQRLFSLCHIVLCQRPGWSLDNHSEMNTILAARQADKSQLDSAVAQGQQAGLILPVAITPQPYSSTAIRAQLLTGELTIEGLPDEVSQYIQQHQLYR